MTAPGRPLLARASSYAGIIGNNNLAELWDCRSGVGLSGSLVTSWTGLIRGIQLTPYSNNNIYAPTYAADGSLYQGRSVLHFARANTQSLQVTLSTHIGSSSDRPEVIAIARVKTAVNDGASGNILWVCQLGGETIYNTTFPAPTNAGIAWNSTSQPTTATFGVAAKYFYVAEDATSTTNAGNQGTYDNTTISTTIAYQFNSVGNLTASNPNGLLQCWVNGGLSGLFPEGGVVDASYTSDLYLSTHPIGPIKNYSVGGTSASSSTCIDMSLAMLIHCFNPLTDTQRTAVYSLAKADWGV